MGKKLRTASRWLTPGMGLKRWLVVILLGTTILALGFGLLLRDLYGNIGYPDVIRVLALQELPRWVRALIFGSLGLGIMAYGLYKINQTLVNAFSTRAMSAAEMAETLHDARRRQRGPKIVTIGGGTGMSVLLRGLKKHTDHITAIVTVADDGGSSGRLRRSLGVLPPGDFRNCIAALADDDALTTQLFQFRFVKNDDGNDGLGGHSFGNLFIIAMSVITGSFERAIAESGKVLSIRGQILPSTLADVTLYADIDTPQGSSQVRGESAIPEAQAPIERVYLDPATPPAFPGAVQALLEADLIVLGPGSLYTSLLPNLLVPDIKMAIEASLAPKIYICNVATQPGETYRYTVSDHITALEKHVGPQFFSHVLVNNNLNYQPPPTWSLDLVNPTITDKINYVLVSADVVDTAKPWRHDSQKLAQSLMDWYMAHLSKNTSP